MARKPDPFPCWKCLESHLHPERVYYCQACEAAVCYSELYAADHGLQHDTEDGPLCGPVRLLTELARTG